MDEAADDDQPANFIVAGDFNNIGMDLTFSARDISLEDEKNRIKTMYESRFDPGAAAPLSVAATFGTARTAPTRHPTSTTRGSAALKPRAAPLAGPDRLIAVAPERAGNAAPDSEPQPYAQKDSSP